VPCSHAGDKGAAGRGFSAVGHFRGNEPPALSRLRHGDTESRGEEPSRPPERRSRGDLPRGKGGWNRAEKPPFLLGSVSQSSGRVTPEYRGLGRYLHSYQLVRIFLSLLAALTIDTFLFTSACFIQHPSYAGILYSNLMARFFVGGFYSVILAVYIRGAERDRLNAPLWHLRFADLVSGVRYRGKYEALKKAFVRDVLTRVYSRGFFDEALAREMARSSRSSEPLSLMMVDIDLFKQVNDKHGHQAGDSVLRAVGALLLSSSRAFDLPCRYGGDEFAVILPSADGDQAYVLATRLQAALRERCARTHPDVLPAAVTFTIGIATFPDDAQNPDGLIKIADNRLYEGKHAGKNCIIRGETPVPPLSA